MTKVLFIGMSLNIGGAEKSLVNLLNLIDFQRYEVSLLLFQKEGAFLNQIPKEVQVIDVPEITTLFQSIKKNIHSKNRNLRLSAIRYYSTALERLRWKQFDQIRLHRWEDFYCKHIPPLPDFFDLAIAYAGGETAYYMLEKVNANKKIYYFHSDYSKIDIDPNAERKYVDKADKIVTISPVCRDSLIQLFPEKKEDIIILNNLSAPDLIRNLAEEYYPAEYIGKASNGLFIVSVGRLHRIKGFDIAIDAAKELYDKGVSFKWFIIGEGEERSILEKKIRQYNLEKQFILVGAKENPYPYIKYSDILVQPSRFEGKSVVLDEAKILGKPIIVTNYDSARDQVRNGENGLLVEIDSSSIAQGIERFINQPNFIADIASTNEINEEQFSADMYLTTLLCDNSNS